MKFFILLALVVLGLSSVSLAEKSKGRRSSVFNLPANAKVRAEDVEQYLHIQNDYDDDDVEAEVAELRQAGASIASDGQVPAELLKADSSKGRLFLKKFLLLGSLLGNKQNTQPIIPIIITGAGNTATGPISTSPASGTLSGSGTITTTPTTRAIGIESDDYLIGEEDILEDQQLFARANENKLQNYFKLKSGKGNQQGGLQFVLPPKYMRYFKNNPNVVPVNPTGFNNGAKKQRKVRFNNNGNVKRKRSKSPLRRFVQQQ